MAHGSVCPCPNCSGGGSWFIRLCVVAGFVAIVATGGAAVAVEAFVHRLVADALTSLLVACVATFAAYIAVATIKDRRKRRAEAAPVASVAAAQPVDELAGRRERRSA